MRYIQTLSMLIALTVLLNGCVTSSNSTLTSKADPDVAVQRYVQLGLEYIKRDDLHRARKHLTRALEIAPEDASANAAFGLISHQEGDIKTAEISFKKAIASDENYTRGRTYYGAFLFSEKRYKQALEQFEVAANDTAYVGRSQIFTNIALCNVKLNNNEYRLGALRNLVDLNQFEYVNEYNLLRDKIVSEK